MLINSTSLTLAAANAALIIASNTPAGAGNLTIATGTLDVPRRVLLTFGSESAARTVLITGTNRQGARITETLTTLITTAGTAYTVQDFATVTAVTVYAAWSAAMTVGTNAVGSTQWIFPTNQVTPFNLAIGLIVVSGSVTSTVEYTYDNPNNLAQYGLTTPAVFQFSPLAGIIATTDSVITHPLWAYRLTNTSGAGTMRMVSLQAGVVQG